MRDLRPIDRLTLLVCVLTGVVVRIVVDPYLELLPEQYIVIRMLFQFFALVGSVVGVSLWILHGSLRVSHDDNEHAEVIMQSVIPIGGYVITETEAGHAITCLCCGTTSYNPNDVANRWCARCATFHIPQTNGWKSN